MQNRSHSPGPANYQVQVSTFLHDHDNFNNTFGKAKKTTIFNQLDNKPGPGNYIHNLDTIGKAIKASFSKVFVYSGNQKNVSPVGGYGNQIQAC
jgi:hypothetical protein